MKTVSVYKKKCGFLRKLGYPLIASTLPIILYNSGFYCWCKVTCYSTAVAYRHREMKQSKEEALWGMLVADAIAMPVHWYYNPEDIKAGYGGWLAGYTAPARRHPSSILNLSNVGGSGRSGLSGKSKPVIGNVILHDKLKYWSSGDRSIHYHQGMKAGDSTLNSLFAMEIMKTLVSSTNDTALADDRSLRGTVLQNYVKFMTSPGSHNDTYAESFHRSFFKDWADVASPPTSAKDLIKWAEDRYSKKAQGHSDHQLVVIGSFVPVIPWVVFNAHRPETECVSSAVDFIKLTHPEPSLLPFVELYAKLLYSVLNGKDLKQEVLRTLESPLVGGVNKKQKIQQLLKKAEGYPLGSESRLKVYQSATFTLGSACYVEGAMSSMLFLALEFADDFEAGVLANANCGGENCHRGAALGALLGAQSVNNRKGIPQKLKDGLGSSRKTMLSICQLLQSSATS